MGTQKAELTTENKKTISTRSIKCKTRREEVILTRLRFYHSGFNKTLTIVKNNAQICMVCNVVENVDLAIIHCIKLNNERARSKQRVREAGRN